MSRTSQARPSEALETVLRTALGLLLLPALLIYASTAVYIGTLFKASSTRLHYFYVWFARTCLRVAATKLDVYGLEHLEPGQAYVVVPNHESTWDPPVLVAGLPQLVLRFIIKKELMRIPIFGTALQHSGNVRVVRSKTGGDVERIRQGMDERDPAVSILFFAEGTRARDGALHPFKKGAFITAIAYGLPILPVAHAGNFAIWPKGKLQLRPRPAVIQVGEPIPTDGCKHDDRATLRDQTHEAVAKLRSLARQHVRALGYDPGGID
ncbi:MAG: lysophospholipid acyltransferase family protein [Planctomycetota bacterium]|jgi:1-acyl-sn-glycerol-3-phosphate acyltransferase